MAVFITAHKVTITFDSMIESCRLVRPTIHICTKDNYTHLRKKQTRIPEAYTLFRGHNSAGACLVKDRDNLSNYNNLCGCIP